MYQVRAKFICTKVNSETEGSVVEMEAVTSGSDENESFFKYTPAGKLEMAIVNPNVKFEEGKEYYLDFTEAQ